MGRLLVAVAALVSMLLPGCKTEAGLDNISRVIYTSDAGPILPELQWHEEFVIARNKVSLSRNGRVPGTKVNAGSWKLAVDAATVAALFDRLKSVNPSSVKRIEPQDQPDGGQTDSYTIVYGKNQELNLTYDPGATYENGASVVEPIREFLKGLAIPAEAQRYK